MAASITILCGPARSGKTTRLLTDYRTALRDESPGCALWLSSNRHAVASLLGQLLGDDLTHCANPQCMTFARFAQSVLDASPAPLRPITELMKQRLLQDLITKGMVEERFVHFAPIIDTPGLLQLVTRTIKEWKRLEIWPDELLSACKQQGFSQKDRELIWLYDEYQRVLNTHQLYDSEGRAWSARERLRGGQLQPFENLRHVFVDGFTDFTRTEYEVLDILADRVATLTVSLPLDGPVETAKKGTTKGGPFRTELFAKAVRTQRELQNRHPDARVELMARRPTDWPAMDHLEANLFQLPTELQPTGDTAGIEIVEAAGQLSEIEVLARHVKRMLTSGDSKAPCQPQDTLVVFRSLAEVGPLVREVFERFGIPIAIENFDTLHSKSCIAAIVAWLQLVNEDWPFRKLLAMLSHNSLQPAWPEWQAGKAAVAAEFMVRRLQLPLGKSELAQRVARLAAAWKETEGAAVEGSRQQLRAVQGRLAYTFLDRLSRTFDELPAAATATATEWASRLSRLASELGLGKLIKSSASEEAAWNQLMKSMRSIDRMATWMGEPAELLSLSDVLELVSEIAEFETLPLTTDEVGAVRVVGATAARSLSAPYVFIAGLTEKAFPAAEREDRLYSEAETARLITAGLPFATRLERSQEEMLLFYEIITRATRRLTLSYPGLDPKAQPLTPSPYLVDLDRACGEGRIARRIDQELSPVPRADEVFCERDLRLRAVFDSLQGERTLLAGMIRREQLATEKKRGASTVSNLLAALETTHARSRGPGFGPFEGIFSSDAVLAKLAERFGPTRCWSPSQLEAYAYCPFRFFSERVMRLEPLGDLALEVDHAMRGQILHGTLTNLHRKLNDLHQNPTSPTIQSAAEFEQAAAEVLGALLETIATDTPVGQALREVDRRLLTQWLANYYGQHQRYDELWGELDSPLRPAHFEVSFGPTSDSLDDAADVPVVGDALTTTKPLELERDGNKLSFRGRIDRVDLGVVSGQKVFNVVDYKSGSKYKFSLESVSTGETIQLPLYALAIEQLLLADEGALPWQASYWLIKEKGFNHRSAIEFHHMVEGHLVPNEEWMKVKDQLLDRIFGLVRGIRQGEFPMFSPDEHCTSRCDFRTVCRVAQTRSLEKTWQPPGASE